MFTMQLPDHLEKKIVSKLCYLGSLGGSQEVFPMVQMRKTEQASERIWNLISVALIIAFTVNGIGEQLIIFHQTNIQCRVDLGWTQYILHASIYFQYSFINKIELL